MSLLVQKAQQQLRKIDNSKVFQGIVIAVILLSALLIGAKTHNLSSNIIATLLLLDVAVTVFFAVEISIRYLACPQKKSFFKSGWNIFDTIIVIGSLVPSGGSGVLLARLLRVFRVLRLVSMEIGRASCRERV